MKPTVLLLAPLWLFACTGEGTTDETGDDTEETEETEPAYFEPVAVGIELEGGYDHATGELLSFSVDEGTTFYTPYVVLTWTTMEYFSADTPEDQEAESCYAVADFSYITPTTPFPVKDYESGVDQTAWHFYEGSVEIVGMEDDPNCTSWDPDEYPGGDPMATFDGMHLGLAVGPMTDYLEAAWSEESLTDYGTSMATLYVAVNHPTTSGYDFIGYNWVTAIVWEMDLDTGFVASDSEDLLIPTGDPTEGGYIRSFAYWYEDFPNLDLSLLQEGVPPM